jgi:murein DD-endopeptidase MepM/ murein hydrolase activator NlpD
MPAGHVVHSGASPARRQQFEGEPLAHAVSRSLIVAVSFSAASFSAAVSVPAAGTPSAQVGIRGVAVPSVPAGTGRSATARAKPPGADTGATDTPRGVARGRFVWPLSPRPAVLRQFEQAQNQWSPGHRGVDLLAAVGQPVLSAGEGVVAFSGVIAGRGVMAVRHSGGLRTTYAPVDERLASGAVVHRGDRIGILSPAPGHCAPRICLHWGAISKRTYRNPLSLLGFGRPILLPLG